MFSYNLLELIMSSYSAMTTVLFLLRVFGMPCIELADSKFP